MEFQQTFFIDLAKKKRNTQFKQNCHCIQRRNKKKYAGGTPLFLLKPFIWLKQMEL